MKPLQIGKRIASLRLKKILDKFRPEQQPKFSQKSIEKIDDQKEYRNSILHREPGWWETARQFFGNGFARCKAKFSSGCRVLTLQRKDIESKALCIGQRKVELVADIPIGISAFCFLDQSILLKKGGTTVNIVPDASFFASGTFLLLFRAKAIDTNTGVVLA